ncbi:MAG: YdcF family protein [Eubacteriales bacterium]|nr:YdcF family protein [Eubacteriales bacterium]
MKSKQWNDPGKKKRAFFALFVLFVLFASAPFLISAGMCASVEDRILSLEDASNLGADAILVLGARVQGNGKPSGILEDRLLTGIAAYQNGVSDRLLMSGDHGQEDYDEVSAMKTYAVEAGIPSDKIFLDHAGFSTYESLYRARDIFQVKRVLIVTQQYHLYRALYVAEKMGLDAYGVAADLRTYPGMPRFEAREILARCKDFFFTLFMPLPTYLGAEIPITGSGDLTNG